MPPAYTFTCAPSGDGWTVVAALQFLATDAEGTLVVTRINVAEFERHFESSEPSGEIVTRNGQRRPFKGFEARDGLLTVRMTATAEELRGGRIELKALAPARQRRSPAIP
jgi:hypothetical protein